MFSSISTYSCPLLVLLVLTTLSCSREGWCQHQQAGSGGGATRATLSFEDTIDEFLRQAQDGNDAMDIQVSTCKISSQQLVATAQATAARVLKGVCNPSEIEDRFHNMEVQLGDQLNVVKAMLLSLEEKIVDQDQELKRQYRRLMSSVTGIKQTKSGGGSGSGNSSGSRQGSSSSSSSASSADQSSSSSSYHHSTPYTPQVPHRAEEVIEDDDDVLGTDSSLSTSVSASSVKSGQVGPRSDEISRYNSTVYIESGRRVFSYYWIITGMSYKLNNWNQKRAIRSNSFYIYPGGYRMYMKALPKYSATTMYIHVGITKGEFDDGISWPFTYTMRAQVLAQDEGRNRALDLKSRIWNPRELCSGSNWRKPVVGDNPECVGLGFPHDVIRTSDYIWNDRIIIKLNVYLD